MLRTHHKIHTSHLSKARPLAFEHSAHFLRALEHLKIRPFQYFVYNAHAAKEYGCQRFVQGKSLLNDNLGK